MSPQPFVIETEIEWAELDLFGHVNNVAFFSYVQKARIRFCELIGLTSLNDSDKLGFIVASSKCDFKLPLFYPGKIKIELMVSKINNTSFELSYQILNQQNQVAALATDVLVVFNYNERKKRNISDNLKLVLLNYQKV